MPSRITIARMLNRLGNLVGSLPIAVLKPEDLVQYSRQSYSTKESLRACCDMDVVAQGLSPEEESLLNAIPLSHGNALVIGVGGGREAIVFAKRGYTVTGIDFVPAMLDQARKNAALHGVQLTLALQEASEMDFRRESFDMVWISDRMYSSVPTRKRRTLMLKKIHEAIVPGGYFLCQFQWDSTYRVSEKTEGIKKMMAALTLGNREYETGDTLWAGLEFSHIFFSKDRLMSELCDPGFHILHLRTRDDLGRGDAVLQRPTGENATHG